MRILSLFLITLLCFAIPIKGIAGIVVNKTPCPAEAEMTKNSNAYHDCCNDADTAAKSGKSCKAEKECQPISPVIMTTTEDRILAATGKEEIGILRLFASTCYPSSAWRPPNQT